MKLKIKRKKESWKLTKLVEYKGKVKGKKWDEYYFVSRGNASRFVQTFQKCPIENSYDLPYNIFVSPPNTKSKLDFK